VNRAVLAVAGASKTQSVIEEALSDPSRRVLITTYTVENLRQIKSRICSMTGVVPDNVELVGWFGFLLSHGIRPYQADFFARAGVVRGLNFVGQRPRFARGGTVPYWIDGNRDVWKDAVSAFVYDLNARSAGAVMSRIAEIYDVIFVDEVQDLVGWDLEVLDLLFAAPLDVTVMGDVRQHTYSTNQSPKNRAYRGTGLSRWIDERTDACARQDRQISHRCHQGICDFASGLFPDLPELEGHDELTGHDGIHTVTRFDVLSYCEQYRPQVLRYNKRSKTQGLTGMNIGISKGSTFDRVLIFPTKPMLQYLEHRDPDKLRSPEKLYVAVTRARHSVAFVV
jgi:DNA helicase-2/ATP-dependent DNA helicase PcrA